MVSRPVGDPTTLVLVRHGVTEHTTGRRFSGGLAGSNPGLSEEGRAQAAAVAGWLGAATHPIDAVVSSPVRRTRETAAVIADALGRTVVEEPGFAEMEFGTWDGRTFDEVGEQHREELEQWLGSLDVAPGGTGESFREVETRVLSSLQRVLDEHAGRTVVVVSHVTPIKTLVAHVLDAPLLSVFRMQLTPASVTVLSFLEHETHGPQASMRLFNGTPGDLALGVPNRW